MGSYLNIEEWADAFIRVNDEDGCQNESHPDFLAAYEFMDLLVGDEAERCWRGILAVVDRCPSDRVLGALAAGPVEDLLTYSGRAFIERIEVEERRNTVFRQMLKGVWKSGDAAVWARIASLQSR